MRRYRQVRTIALLAIAVYAASGVSLAQPGFDRLVADHEPSVADGPMYTARERFGIAFVTEVPVGNSTLTQSIDQYNVSALGVGWYSDWKYRASPPMPADATLEYLQLIRVGDWAWPPNWSSVQNAVLLNPGATWMIGNEPECPNQDGVTPDTYAERYHDVYVNIKGWDPTAQIAIGAIVEPTPLRFLWLQRAMAAYQQRYGTPMIVDVWNIHVQILPEGAESGGGYDNNAGAGVPVGIDPVAEGVLPRQYALPDSASVPIFKSMIQDFRDWMEAQGERRKPLIISEMGVLMPSIYLVEGGSEAERQLQGDQRIFQYMVQVYDWLQSTTSETVGHQDDENRLVQRWLWFSLNGSIWDEYTNLGGFNGSLYDYVTKEPTQFGRRMIVYRNEVGRVHLPLAMR